MMSITVADVMKLPSMRGATVLGGEKGLSRIVSSISVLEYAQTNTMQTELFENIDFLGNELAITGFMNNPNDVELQCANLRRLIEIGEVGVILFYVGIVMKCVDQRLIDIANEMDFPLISMPVGQMNQRYSEVICEVMELIYREQMRSTNLTTELLERAAGLPVHQRTVDSMLRMLSDRLHASVVLMDNSRRVLNEATWPRAFDAAKKEELSSADFPMSGTWKHYKALDIHIFRDNIETRDGHTMDLLIFKEGEIPDVVMIRQAVEVVQLAVSMWSERHDRLVIGELVRAILQDEPMKMRRLADIFNVDVASINSMWLVSGMEKADEERIPEIIDSVSKDIATYSSVSIVDVYDGILVMFMSGPDTIHDTQILTDTIMEELEKRKIRATLTRSCALRTTTMVRDAFLSHRDGLEATRKIYRKKHVYTLEQVHFAQHCQELIGRGERTVNDTLRILKQMNAANDEEAFLDTLECYLLDTQMSVTRTAESMFLHKNTIKYRLQRMADQLGFVPGEFPDSIPLITACALRRLLHS